MTSKDCCWLTTIITFLIIIVSIPLLKIIWSCLKPSKPRFIFQDVTVYAFNSSGNPPKLLTSNFQITLTFRNPNHGTQFYYDGLVVYATYRSRQITLKTLIPPTYQGEKELTIWKPFIYATSVPVPPSNALGLEKDQHNGGATVMIHADGRVRSTPVGSFMKYHLSVRCSAFINFGNKTAGFNVGDNVFRYFVT